jgi:hypothetical protein
MEDRQPCRYDFFLVDNKPNGDERYDKNHETRAGNIVGHHSRRSGFGKR